MFVYSIGDITRNLQSTVATSATQGGSIYRRVYSAALLLLLLLLLSVDVCAVEESDISATTRYLKDSVYIAPSHIEVVSTSSAHIPAISLVCLLRGCLLQATSVRHCCAQSKSTRHTCNCKLPAYSINRGAYYYRSTLSNAGDNIEHRSRPRYDRNMC